MGIKSNRKVESYYNYFSTSGKEAGFPHVAPPIAWGGDRGVYMGGWTSIEVNTIDYIDITTLGNATDFGDTLNVIEAPACCSNGTRGIGMAGVEQATRFNTIQYITFATPSNSTDFGDCSAQKNGCGALSNGSRGVVAGGDNSGNNDSAGQ